VDWKSGAVSDAAFFLNYTPFMAMPPKKTASKEAVLKMEL
jgi:hypothetical protein